jgi:hypothetical protein
VDAAPEHNQSGVEDRDDGGGHLADFACVRLDQLLVPRWRVTTQAVRSKSGTSRQRTDSMSHQMLAASADGRSFNLLPWPRVAWNR